MKKQKFDFEQSIDRLDEIIAAIEGADTPLDTSLALYKEGMALAADCAEKLAGVEKEVVMMTKDAEGIVRRRSFNSEGDGD